MIERGFEWLARLLFVAVALALFTLAISLVVSGGWQLLRGAFGGQVGIYNLMNGVGLLIVSLAIADVAKFVIEENVVRDREMRSPAEALRSLTKFMTIIIIALSLEAVVGIFEAGREKRFEQMVYPTMVMMAAVVALVGLGAFQFLSRRSQREAAAGADDADANTSESDRQRIGTACCPSPQQRGAIAARIGATRSALTAAISPCSRSKPRCAPIERTASRVSGAAPCPM